MFAAIRSMMFTITFFGGSTLLMLFTPVIIYLRPSYVPQLAYKWSRFHYVCVRFFLGIKINIEGEIPTEPVLFAVKHESMFETLDAPRLFRKPAIFAKKQLFTIPVWGRAAKLYGNIPVDRDGGARSLRHMINEAKSFIASGRQVMIFPEGTRVPHGKRPPLRSGFAGLYKMLGVPVVPVAVNSGLLSPKRNGSWQSGTITYKIGETIPAGLDRNEVEAKVHEAINALNATTA